MASRWAPFIVLWGSFVSAKDVCESAQNSYGASLLQRRANPLSQTWTAKTLVAHKHTNFVGGEVPCLNGKGDCYNKMQRMSPQDALTRYQLLHSTRKLFDRHKIWHVASGGTLLGAVRNKGIIPHDDDLDLDIMWDDFNVSEALKADLKKNGLGIGEVSHFRKKVLKMDMPPPRVYLDLFGLVKQGGKITYPEEWRCHGKCLQAEWPASIAEEGGLIQWPFGGTTVPAPPRDISETFLTIAYGPTWRNESICNRSVTWHECHPVEDVEYDLTGKALPDSPLFDPF